MTAPPGAVFVYAKTNSLSISETTSIDHQILGQLLRWKINGEQWWNNEGGESSPLIMNALIQLRTSAACCAMVIQHHLSGRTERFIGGWCERIINVVNAHFFLSVPRGLRTACDNQIVPPFWRVLRNLRREPVREQEWCFFFARWKGGLCNKSANRRVV